MNWMKQLRRQFQKATQNPDRSTQPARSNVHLADRNRLRLGKLLLLAGVGLSILVVLELRQDVSTALEPLTPASQPLSSRSPATAPSNLQIAISADPNAVRPERQIAQINPSQIAANQWAGSSFPVEGFQAYTSPFGYRRSATGGSSQEFHYGLDLAAPMGSYVRNWWSGRVVEVSDNSNCGTSVVVESGHWLHIYCHMQGQVETINGQLTLLDRAGGIQIVQGQQVSAGTQIGRVGMTGRTTGPHLHWGLKYDGSWVNPALVLRAMYAGQQATARTPQ